VAIYISGSLAYDRIMNFPGKFTDSILADQIHNLNVSFFIDSLQEQWGGNAGNIDYTLSLLAERPVIVATAGKDFGRYAEHLQQMGLPLDGIRQIDFDLTAGAYIMTDQSNNQITGFHAAAMMTPSTYDFPHLKPEEDIALIGPSNPDDMGNHPRLFKEKGIRYIYDPAQQLPILSSQQILESISGAWLLIGNDYEIQLIMNKTERSKEELVALTAMGLITTYGEKGSVVTPKDGEECQIDAVPVNSVLDPTGAGDAYRAGLIKGIVLGQPLEDAAQLGSTCAAYCIESEAPQGHYFTLDDFFRRHSEAFGMSL
jgi:adenosine kinase